ncbi:Sirohydrochlorin cobaltochelatase [compost metagenome]
MLFAAAHAKIHIPYEIGEAGKRYPAVEFVYGRPIGVHQKVMDILTSRMESAGFPANNAEFPIELSRREPDTAVLLIGRGSSDRDANGDFYKMSRLLWERLPVRWVENCFIGVTEPTFEEGLERCLALGAKKVFILPYFLFTGVLMKRIQEMTADFALRYPDIELELAGYFGSHPKLVEMLLERVEEALGGQAYMNCGTCDYRQNVSHEHGHAHGHSHEHHHGHEHSHSHEHQGHSHFHADAHHHSHTHSHEHHREHGHSHSQNPSCGCGTE